MKVTKLIIITLLVLSVGGLIFGVYLLVRNMDFFKSEETASDIVGAPRNPQKGDIGYVEKNESIPVDDSSRFSGRYEYVADGELFLTTGDKSVSYKLSDDLIAVNCTSQSFASARAADTSLVTEVKMTDKTTLQDSLKGGEDMFVMTAEENGAPVIHTIFLSAAVCEAIPQ